MANFTKQAIKTTFLNLLRERPLNEISVKMIVENCGINRKSFYYHYRDIPDLIDEITAEGADSILQSIHAMTAAEDSVREIVEAFRQNRQLILNIYHSVDRPTFDRTLLKNCDRIMRAFVDSAAEGRSIGETDRELLVRAYRSLCFGLISEWLLEGMKDDPVPALLRLCELRRGMLAETVTRCENEKVSDR